MLVPKFRDDARAGKATFSLAGALVLFAALSALFWWPELASGRALFYDLLLRIFYPDAVLFGESLRGGHLPFWNPYIYSGVPFLANPQTALFYPFTYLYAVFSFARATAIFVWIHSTLAAFFMYFLARELDLSVEGAILAGVVYAFNGFYILHYTAPSNFAAYIWLPLIAGLLRRAAAQGNRRTAAVAGLALALEIFAGHPQFAFYTVAAASVFVAEERRNFRQTLPALLESGFWGAAFSAIAWMPFLSFMLKTPRLQGLGFEWATGYSLRASELLRMLVYPLWNRYFTPQGGDPHVMGFYFGLAVLVLAVCGLFSGRRARVFSLLAFGGFFLALGRYNPLYYWIYRAFYPLRLIRFPAQAIFLSCFGVAGLAGLGLNRLRLARTARWATILLVVFDLWLFSRQAVITLSPTVYQASLPLPTALKKITGDDYRVIMTPKTRQTESWRGRDALDAWLELRNSLAPDTAMAAGILDADGDEVMRLARYGGVLDAVGRSPQSPWLDAVSARYVLTFWTMPRPKFKLVRRGYINVYENKAALPRAYYSSRAIHVDDGAQLAYLDAHPKHDLRSSILWGGPSDPPVPSARKAARAQVEITRADANKVSLRVFAPAPGWVVLTDAYAAGWSARVNGRPSALYRVNYFQRGVRVGAGVFRVTMSYVPPYLRLGAVISLLALAAALVFAAV